MKQSVLALLVCLAVVSFTGSANVAAQVAAQDKSGPLQSNQQRTQGFIPPNDVNVRIDFDARTVVMMAAVNLAGFDAETGGDALSPARAEVRKDFAGISPALKARLTAFYKGHRRPGVDEVTDSARYAMLSLLMTAPPGFVVRTPSGTALPEDLQALMTVDEKKGEPAIQSLLREFYVSPGIKATLEKYMKVADSYAAAYRAPIGRLIFDTLVYFHTNPETIINMRPLVISAGEGELKAKKEPKVFERNRTRQVFVVTESLLALNTSIVRGDILNQKDDLLTRRIGDDYIVIIGPSWTHTLDGVREALIRFVIDPLIERHLKFALDYKDDVTKLAASVPTASKQYSSSVYLILRESLAQAAESRMKRIAAASGGPAYSEDDAVNDLAQAYLRGAVLSFHFYNSLRELESVGLSLETFMDQMIATTKFDREAARPKEFEPVVARVAAARANRKTEAPSELAMAPIAKKILASDDLIREKKYGEARVVLESVLAQEPTNVRALYGMAQVESSLPSAVESDPNGEENDKIQAQHDRLERAIKLYQRVLESASPETEKWMIQWAHVLLGRIYDFQEFRADALGEYEKAIAMGAVANGALKEAQDGKLHPFGQKN